MRIVLKWRFDMTICRCRRCRLGIIGACVAARVGVSTASCYAHEAPEVDGMPLDALSGLTVTSAVSGIAVAPSFLDRPVAMADEPIRMPSAAQRIAAYDHEPEPMVAWDCHPPGMIRPRDA
jgi:hypothetical protein